MRHKHQRPHKSSQQTGQSWSTNQHQSAKTPRKQAVKYVVYPYKQDQRLLEDSQGEHYTVERLDHEETSAVDYPSNSAKDHLSLEPPSDTMFEDKEDDCNSKNSKNEKHKLDQIDLDQIEWDNRSDLDINAAPYQVQPEQSSTFKAFLEDGVVHFFPESNSTQQSEPDFDLKNYRAEDVDNWASTLLADEFEHLCVMGTNARTKSFQQYAISNLNQLTQTLTQQSSSTHEHLEHLVSTSNGCQDYRNYHHHQPDDISSNNFDQQRLASPDDESRSAFYNHSGNCNSHLEAFDDIGFDDSTFDNGGFDNDDFEDGGFNNGGFDNGGFDDCGFDDVKEP
ncbi:hypothetical protein PGTUg99_018226 [Puccinia graminis f. sp. tritici]|uniref:Uncharacterized protein n=1 Tax=Puccinia graminis f. sp. tritici TaxID=56615 RepID=A0A5B0NS82_PUCGR|nr:hypothetical protein PGTUg99_018226 [Puccinia graminis f. sp. tritici]